MKALLEYIALVAIGLAIGTLFAFTLLFTVTKAVTSCHTDVQCEALTHTPYTPAK